MLLLMSYLGVLYEVSCHIIKGSYARVRILNSCMHEAPLKFYRMVKELKAACILKVLYCKMTSFVQHAYSGSINVFLRRIGVVLLNP